jgi:hypothetical protein
MTSLLERLEQVRHHADTGGLPVRRKDAALYALLAECLSICEWVRQEKQEDQLRQHLLARLRAGKITGRARYVERASDVYTVVCRYALGEWDTRTNYTRYAVALREAAKRQVTGERLADYLREAGGIMALFNGRPNPERWLTSRTLHLNQSVTVPKDAIFTLTLRRDGNGFFNVLGTSEAKK